MRRWIAQRGGLTPRMIFLRGKQLQAHVQALLPRRPGVGVAAVFGVAPGTAIRGQRDVIAANRWPCLPGSPTSPI